MFGRTTDQLAATLMAFQDQARIECRHDQYKMPRKMAEYMAQDRRFDSIADKEQLAREAIDARLHGRELDLTKRIGSNANTTSGYIVRNV